MERDTDSSLRPILPTARIDSAIRDKIASNHRDLVDEVAAAVAEHRVVVVGMKQNPYPRRARKALRAAGIEFCYLEYGSYFSTWRRRTALKMWTGWPTFPMVFVDGVLIGGASDLQSWIESGQLSRALATPAASAPSVQPAG